MRSLLLFLPVVLAAQTPPPPKAPAKAATPATAPKPAGTTAPRPAGSAAPATVRPAAPKPAAPALMTDDQKTIYAIGLSLYRSLAQFDFTPAELEIVKRAISDAQAKKPAVPLEEWGPKIQGLATARTKAASSAYLAKAAAEPGAVKTESGLVYKELRPRSEERRVGK